MIRIVTVNFLYTDFEIIYILLFRLNLMGLAMFLVIMLAKLLAMSNAMLVVILLAITDLRQ